MKKAVRLSVLLMLVLIACIGFAACVSGSGNNGDNNKPDKDNPAFLIAPVLKRTDFSVNQSFGIGDEFIAYLSCAKDPSVINNNISEFEIFIDGEKKENNQSVYLHDLEYDKIHTVEVTAVGYLNSNNVKLRSEKMTLKINITKVDAPANVRMTLNSGATNGSVVWDGEQDVYFDVLYSGIDFIAGSGDAAPVWFDTGRKTLMRDYGSGHSASTIRSIYASKTVLSDFDYFNKLSIRLYPKEWAKFTGIGEEGDVFALQMRSDFSETSARVFGFEMSQPSNLKWDTSVPGRFTFDPVGGMDYSYQMNTYDGFSIGGFGVADRGEGAGVGYINLESYVVASGTVTFGIESVYSKIDFISSDIYRLYYSKFDWFSENCEKLTYNIVKTKIDTPKNIRVEGSKLVWDAVPNVITVNDRTSYWVTIGSEEYGISITTENGIHELAIADIAESLPPLTENLAPFDAEIKISAKPKGADFQMSPDGTPIIYVYDYSDESDPQNAPVIRINSIPAPSGIIIDFETKTLSWDAINEAESYEVTFFKKDGTGRGRAGIQSTVLIWDDEVPDISELEKIKIKTKFKPEITINGQNIEITISSVTVFYPNR